MLPLLVTFYTVYYPSEEGAVRVKAKPMAHINDTPHYQMTIHTAWVTMTVWLQISVRQYFVNFGKCLAHHKNIALENFTT